ncbi:uncharacterized protein [Physcomitrium patens]|uniref:Transcription factor MYC/MYB N-terminal domain-containing protein n=2 Tax=Physcomitrium patens TaxID=3218 RepID=A0A2K1LBW5_PHYPA|nr:uncharacterized protein LOC112280446 isoform X2 [Physcomitrium patens]PNR63513.1 hypothetical protein PHYPA_001939 [Physcomitrium patens]|eukprot:XP_024371738.1 uncharacterized protein LOC112280446 isoform X2 [Physcomitrella patens]
MDARQGLPMLNHQLQHTLRMLCTEMQWVYAVFWRILPRNYPPPQWDNEGDSMDRSKGNKRNWILVWEDGFCNFSTSAAGAVKDVRGALPFFQAAQPWPQGSDHEREGMSPDLFFKMSHDVYNYGEGLVGKVAADSSHKWVYRKPEEHKFSFLSQWHSSLDPHPRAWEAQFKSGIETIAVVAVQEGVLQLGSNKTILEDLNFVLHTQRGFNNLQSVPRVYLPHPNQCGRKKQLKNGGFQPFDPNYWMAPSDCDRYTSIPHLTPRSIDQFLSPQIGPQLWFSSSGTTVLGVKRPPESEPSSLSFKKPSYMNGSGGFKHQPECPSPPKSLGTGHRNLQGASQEIISTNTSSSLSSSNSDMVSGEHASDETNGRWTTSMSNLKDSHNFSSSYLDTFDNILDFGTHMNSLEIGDCYNSFLNEIYS